MKAYLVILLSTAVLLLAGTGCQKGEIGRVKVDDSKLPDKDTVQVRLGQGDSDSWGQLDFQITQVFRHQQPLDRPPWHADGGDWTFFNALVTGSPNAEFVFGYPAPKTTTKEFEFSQGQLGVANSAAGSRLVNALARAFYQSRPAPRPVYPLAAFRFGTAYLGGDLQREAEGGFSRSGGGWTALKLFLEANGACPEVYFNFNLSERRGEFSEKDPDYREDLLYNLATALRDGPRPERTPSTDPNLSDHGPMFAEWIRISLDPGIHGFGPQDRFVYWTEKSKGGNSSLYAISLSDQGPRRRLASSPHSINNVIFRGPDADSLLIQETIPKETNVYSSDDPCRLRSVRLQSRESRLIQTPWASSWSFEEQALSPDGRWLVIGYWKPLAREKGNRQLLAFLDADSCALKATAELPEQSLSFIKWRSAAGSMLACLRRGFAWEEESAAYYLLDPIDGRMLETAERLEPAADGAVSPDGRWAAVVTGDKELILHDRKTGGERRFRFHPDDLRAVGEGCVEWAAPRFLIFYGPRLAFIDIGSLKMNYPCSRDEDLAGVSLSSDFRWVLSSRKDGLYLGKIVNR